LGNAGENIFALESPDQSSTQSFLLAQLNGQQIRKKKPVLGWLCDTLKFGV
jgi:hypothetical protein